MPREVSIAQNFSIIALKKHDLLTYRNQLALVLNIEVIKRKDLKDPHMIQIHLTNNIYQKDSYDHLSVPVLSQHHPFKLLTHDLEEHFFVFSEQIQDRYFSFKIIAKSVSTYTY